ncbi:unnamed protein product [Urochloa humidicola]
MDITVLTGWSLDSNFAVVSVVCGAHAICSSSNGSKVHAVEQNTFEVPTVRWKVAHISTYHEGKVLAYLTMGLA